MNSRRACLVALIVVVAAVPLMVVAIAAALYFLGGDEAASPTLSSERATDVGPSGEKSGGRQGEAGSSVATGDDAREGGKLYLAGADPTTLDPALVRDVVSAEYMYEIYSGLVTLSPDLAVIPDLAESWEVDPDGTVYTFTLRNGATFHDGRPVTAEDVVYSIERSCDPSTGSQVAGTYLGDIVGCREKLSGSSADVPGARAPDDARVVLEIDLPKAYFLSKLTYPTSFLLDRNQVESDADWTSRPNGTGPFRLERHVPQETLLLERYPDYYGGPAHLDEVEFDLRPVSATTLYENGELDAVPVGMADLARVRDPLNPLSAEAVDGPGDLGLSYIGFNTLSEPFDDVHVRRAFNLALDKERLADVVLQGAVAPAWWILPPGLPGHDPDAGDLRYDPERALAELAKSSYGDADELPPIVINASGSGGGNTAAEAAADMIGETLGISIVVEQTPWDEFQGELAAGEYDAYMLGWSADYPDAQDFLDVLFHSGSPLNHTGYSNPQVDELLEVARTERDAERRLELYGRAEQQILADAPWLPLYGGVETWLVAPYVQGFELSSIIVPRLAKVWLEQ